MTAAPPPPGADDALVHRARTSAEYLTGLVAEGMLDVVGKPHRLPELLFPHLDPAGVREVWNTALAVGYRAGKVAHRPVWDTAALDRLRCALYEAGYRGMGRVVEATAYTAPSRPEPAGDEAVR
jgi:hypothetical protein